MSKPIIIFGIGKIAEVIATIAMEETDLLVAAFTVDKTFATVDTFMGKPVIAFEDVALHYPPANYDAFVAVGYHDMNRLREQKVKEVLDKGYQLVNVVSKHAHLSSSVKLGYNCFVMAPCIIHPLVTVAHNVFIWSGAMVGHHSILGDNCWLTSACSVSGNVNIGANSFLAVNAMVGHSVKIGSNCFLGANTLVVKNLEDDKVVIAEGSKPIKLTSKQFLKFSNFSSL